jgi:ferredoxin
VGCAVIVGSGAAAAGAAMALATQPDLQITVLDIGLDLEADRRDIVDWLSASLPGEWDEARLAAITALPTLSSVRGLPEKQSYGSDYPFRDVGQLSGVVSGTGVNPSLVSAAYGGFSTVWGAQIMPFTTSVLDGWPVKMSDLLPHYHAVLNQIPFAAEEDDLSRLFPLLAESAPLPEPSDRTRLVLQAYGRHRTAFARLGVTLGKARLALDAGACVLCGRCMTGCPYSLVYSASHTFDRLRRAGRINYQSGFLVVKVSENEDAVTISAKELSTGRVQDFAADRVYLACGAIGTTRIVMNSLGLFDTPLTMAESQQFILPLLSLHGTRDPRKVDQFTLNQFNMTVEMDESGFDLSQIHFYTFDQSFVEALPWPLRTAIAKPALTYLLRRLTVAIGYLPSWRSPRLTLKATRPSDANALPIVAVSRHPWTWWHNPMLRAVLTRMLRVAPMIDLYPILPSLRVAGGGKSYHIGATFPHAADGAQSIFSSDRVGRVGAWKRIHLVDASVFPSVPATTFGLTVMANAHRIAAETIESPM